MDMILDWANWWCGVFGYAACVYLSAPEAVLVLAATAAVVFAVIGLILRAVDGLTSE